MKWRKELNNYPDSPIRHYLDFTQRDIYHCLRAFAGGDNGRFGFIERSEGMPYTIQQLADRVDVDVEVLESTLTKLVDIELLEYSDKSLHFRDWDIEQSVPKNKQKRWTPAQKEAHDRFVTEDYLKAHPEALDGRYGDYLADLVNKGKIEIKEALSDGD